MGLINIFNNIRKMFRAAQNATLKVLISTNNIAKYSSQTTKTIGAVENLINQKLESHFQDSIVFKNVANASWKHNVPPGAETHFEVTLVTDTFQNKKILARNKIVN